MPRRLLCFAFATLIGMSWQAATGVAAPAPSPEIESHARFAPPEPRAPQVLSQASLDRLRAEGQSVLWVFFTDKGIIDAGSFAAALSRVADHVPAAAQARRARETGGKFVPDWYDLPV